MKIIIRILGFPFVLIGKLLRLKGELLIGLGDFFATGKYKSNK